MSYFGKGFHCADASDRYDIIALKSDALILGAHGPSFADVSELDADALSSVVDVITVSDVQMSDVMYAYEYSFKKRR